MPEKIRGCTHLIFKNGKVVNVFTHLSKIPKTGIVHLSDGKIYSVAEFKKSHVHDHDELKPKRQKINISDF